MFEHRLYLPSAGFLLAVVAILFHARRRFQSVSLFASKVIPAFLIFSAIFLSCATYVRNGVWSDEIRLWEDAVRKSPLKARTHDYLGTLYGEKGRFRDSVRELEIAARLNPDDFLIRNNLGTSYLNLGKKDEALAQFRISSVLNPDYKLSHINLGVLYLQKGLIDEAIVEFRVAVRLDPSDRNALRLLEIAEASRAGKPEKTAARRL